MRCTAACGSNESALSLRIQAKVRERTSNTSFTPTDVFALVSIKVEPIRSAKAWASAVGTCRENSLQGFQYENQRNTVERTHLVDFVSHEYLYNLQGNIKIGTRVAWQYATPCSQHHTFLTRCTNVVEHRRSLALIHRILDSSH